MKTKIKVLMASLMVSAMLMSCTFATPVFASTASIESVPGRYMVNADVLNVRTGPGTNYSIVGTLNYGSTVYVTSISNGWARFSFGGSSRRYASAAYLTELH